MKFFKYKVSIYPTTTIMHITIEENNIILEDIESKNFSKTFSCDWLKDILWDISLALSLSFSKAKSTGFKSFALAMDE